MKKLFACVLAVTFCLSLMVGCGGAGAGASCQLTQEGAKACKSGVCLRVRCTTGGTRDVCAGDSCTAACTNAGEQCVALDNGAAFCVPQSVCQ